MGMVTILGTIPTSPQNTGSAAKPESSKYGATNVGSGLEAAQIDSSSRALAESEDTRVDELFNNAKEKGLTVVEEPRRRSVFKFFLAKGKTQPVMIFFDNGCSDYVLQEGVLGVQWDGVVTKRAPSIRRFGRPRCLYQR